MSLYNNNYLYFNIHWFIILNGTFVFVNNHFFVGLKLFLLNTNDLPTVVFFNFTDQIMIIYAEWYDFNICYF